MPGLSFLKSFTYNKVLPKIEAVANELNLKQPNMVLISGDDGKVATSEVSVKELSFLSNVNNNIQTQLNAGNTTMTNTSNELISRVQNVSSELDSNILATSNNVIEYLNIDSMPNGEIFKYVENGFYYGDLNIVGNLTVKNYSINGVSQSFFSSTISDVTEIASDSLNGPVLKIVEKAENNIIELGHGTETKVTMTHDGKLGIGTTTPVTTLDINGNVSASGTINGITTQKLSYLSGVTDNIQSQIDNFATLSGTSESSIGNLTLTSSSNMANNITNMSNISVEKLSETYSDLTSYIDNKTDQKQDIINFSKTFVKNPDDNSISVKDTIWDTINSSNISYGNNGNVVNVFDNKIIINSIDVALISDVNSKQDLITGAATTITTNLLPANKLVVSDANGKVASDDFDIAKLDNLTGVTTDSTVQTQIDDIQTNMNSTTNELTTKRNTEYTNITQYVDSMTASELAKTDGKQGAINNVLGGSLNKRGNYITYEFTEEEINNIVKEQSYWTKAPEDEYVSYSNVQISIDNISTKIIQPFNEPHIVDSGIIKDNTSFVDLGNNQYIYSFKNTSNDVNSISFPQDTVVDVLIVAGGGAGGSGENGVGGGGGGGSVYVASNMVVPAHTEFPIIVGEGGKAAFRENGGNSSAFGITTIGGGAGGNSDAIHGISSGGGGGGGGINYYTSNVGMGGIVEGTTSKRGADGVILQHIDTYAVSSLSDTEYVKYPRENFTQDKVTFANNYHTVYFTYSDGTQLSSKSSSVFNPGLTTLKAFDGIKNHHITIVDYSIAYPDCWMTAQESVHMYLQDGTYPGLEGRTDYRGEWVMIDLGEQIILSKTKIYMPIKMDYKRRPREFRIYGTNDLTAYTSDIDSSEWNIVYEGVGFEISGDQVWHYEYDIPDNTQPYRYYCIIIHKVWEGGLFSTLGEWELFARKEITTYYPLLTKFPRENMDATTFTNSDGVTVACSSSTFNNNDVSHSPFKLFDGVLYSADTEAWLSGDNTYDESGNALVTYLSEYPGELVMIDLGEDVILKETKLYPLTAQLVRQPKEFRIYGTNDKTAFGNINDNQWNKVYDGINPNTTIVNLTDTQPIITKEIYDTTIVKYPKVPYTAASSDITFSSTDEQFNQYFPYKAFDGITYNISNTYFTGQYYNGTDRTHIRSLDVNINGYGGEWLRIDLKENIVLKSYKIYPQNGDPGRWARAPGDFKIFGSKDNITHYELDLRTNITWPSGNSQIFEIPNNNENYRYYTIVVNKIAETIEVAGNFAFVISELELYGNPDTTVEHQQIGTSGEFYYDFVKDYQTTLVKYPRELSQTAQTVDNQQIVYTDGKIVKFKASTVYETANSNSYRPSNLFDGKKTGTGWVGWSSGIHPNPSYNTTTGEAIYTYKDDGYAGEWLMIDLGEQIYLQKMNVYPESNDNKRQPRQFRIYASNSQAAYDNGVNDSDWVLIHERLSDVNDVANNNMKEYDILSSSQYRYYYIVINKTYNGMFAHFAELELFGYPEITNATNYTMKFPRDTDVKLLTDLNGDVINNVSLVKDVLYNVKVDTNGTWKISNESSTFVTTGISENVIVKWDNTSPAIVYDLHENFIPYRYYTMVINKVYEYGLFAQFAEWELLGHKVGNYGGGGGGGGESSGNALIVPTSSYPIGGAGVSTTITSVTPFSKYTTDMLVWYKFDGDLTDSSGNDKLLILNDEIVSPYSNNIGLEFGPNTTVTYTSSNVANNIIQHINGKITFTASFWIKGGAKTASGVSTLFESVFGNSAFRLYISQNSTKLQLVYFSGSWNSTSYFTEGHDIPYLFDDTLKNIVVTADNVNVNIYVNSIMYLTFSTTALSISVANETFTIGKMNSTGLIMSDFRIYNRALTPDEVTELYEFNKPKFAEESTDLLMWYKFDKGDAAEIDSYTINSGTLGTTHNLENYDTLQESSYGVVGNAHANLNKAYLQINSDFDSSALNECSICFWLKKKGINTASDVIFADSSTSSEPFKIRRMDTTDYWDIQCFGGVFDTDGYLNDWKADHIWNHYSFVFENASGSTQLKIYKNNTLVYTNTNGTWTNTIIAKPTIGDTNPDTSLMGNLDDIRVYNRVLTTTELYDLYNYRINVTNYGEGGSGGSTYYSGYGGGNLSIGAYDNDSGGNGAENTGGGGGGAKTGGFGGDGGSGVVVVKWYAQDRITYTNIISNDELVNKQDILTFGQGFSYDAGTNTLSLTDTPIWKDEGSHVSYGNVKVYDNKITIGSKIYNVSKDFFNDTSDMIAWYKFDGDFTDSSGNGQDLVGGTGTSFVDDSVVGTKSISFPDLNNQTLTSTVDLSGNKSFSISFWSYRNNNGENDFVLATPNSFSTNKNLHIGYRNTNVFTFAFYGNELVTTVQNDVNIWVNWTFTYNSINSKIEIYKNGVLNKSGTLSGTTVFLPGIQLGYWNSYNFNGKLDDLRIYNRALTPDEIAILYNNTPPVSRYFLNDTSDMYVWYKFNGDLNDDSGYSRDAIGYNSPTFDENLKKEGSHSVQFAGGAPGTDSQYLTVPSTDFSLWDGFTVSCWVYFEDNTAYARIIDFGDEQNVNKVILSRNNATNKMLISMYNSSWLQISTTNDVIVNNTWMHISWVITKTPEWRLYVNGTLQPLNSSNSRYPVSTTYDNCYIAKSNSAADGYFKGKMDDFRIYKRALSGEEVKALYHMEIPTYSTGELYVNTIKAKEITALGVTPSLQIGNHVTVAKDTQQTGILKESYATPTAPTTPYVPPTMTGTYNTDSFLSPDDNEIYEYAQFTDDGTITFPQDTACDVLVVGGGGGGGGAFWRGGGGGGGGQVKYIEQMDFLRNTTVHITVGAGGAGGDKGTSTNVFPGANGSSTTITYNSITISAEGGGGGAEGRGGSLSYGLNGASGGGGCGTNTDNNSSGGLPTISYTTSPSTYTGYKGGFGGTWYLGGGGGGFGGEGGNANTNGGGIGGIGINNSITGTPEGYGGGGGGGAIKFSGKTYFGGNASHRAGTGGGYSATVYPDNAQFAGFDGNDAISGSGSGGGGASTQNPTSVAVGQKGGNGGSGIVIIRWKKMDENAAVVSKTENIKILTIDSSISNFKQPTVQNATNNQIIKHPTEEAYYTTFTDTTTPGSITFEQDTVCDILVVGGGGAGGNSLGGGGGAGGVVYTINQVIPKGNYSIGVGEGGIGLPLLNDGQGTLGIDQDGKDSYIKKTDGTYLQLNIGGTVQDIVGKGGGGGAVYYNETFTNGRDGGSGGGSGVGNDTLNFIQPNTLWNGSEYIQGGSSGNTNSEGNTGGGSAANSPIDNLVNSTVSGGITQPETINTTVTKTFAKNTINISTSTELYATSDFVGRCYTKLTNGVTGCLWEGGGAGDGGFLGLRSDTDVSTGGTLLRLRAGRGSIKYTYAEGLVHIEERMALLDIPYTGGFDKYDDDNVHEIVWEIRIGKDNEYSGRVRIWIDGELMGAAITYGINKRIGINGAYWAGVDTGGFGNSNGAVCFGEPAEQWPLLTDLSSMDYYKDRLVSENYIYVQRVNISNDKITIGGGGGAGGELYISSIINGKTGIQISITGADNYYAAGGGGGQYNNISTNIYINQGIGGNSIGGNGRIWNGTEYLREATDGLDGTGSGGGGGSYIDNPDNKAGNGGSGIVIIKWYPNKKVVHGSKEYCLRSKRNIWMDSANVIWTSDIRIKKDIEDINDDSALEQVLSLEPKTYKYKNVMERGNNKVFGFVSQQVEKVIPEATTKTANFIPNIYEHCEFTNTTVNNIPHSTITLPDDYDIATLSIAMNSSNISTRVRVINEKNENAELDFLLTSNVSGYGLMTEDISDFTNNSSNVFVYGTEVEDLTTIDKSYLYTLNVCATQVLSRKIDTLEASNSAMVSRIEQLESELNTLQNSFK